MDTSMVIRVWQLVLGFVLLLAAVPTAVYLIARGHGVLAFFLAFFVLVSTTIWLRFDAPEGGTSEDTEHTGIPPGDRSTVSVVMQARAEPPEFMNAQELAAHLGVTERSVRRWIERGQLPAEKPGRTYVIRREDGERMRPGASGAPQLAEDRAQPEDLGALGESELAELRGRYRELQERLKQAELELDAERRRAIRLELELERALGQNHPAARAA